MVIHNLICRQKKTPFKNPLISLVNVWASQLPFAIDCFVMVNFKLQVYSMFFYIICRLFPLFSFWKENVVNVMHFLLLLIEHIKYSMNFEIKLIYIFEPDTCFFLIKKEALAFYLLYAELLFSPFTPFKDTKFY